MSPSMDPDRYQMRDLKRRISKLEDQIGYLKTDWKRTTVGLAELARFVHQQHECHDPHCKEQVEH